MAIEEPGAFDGQARGARLEVADVFRRHGDAYQLAHAGHISRVEKKIMGTIVPCRTPALGGHVEACDDCGVARVAYNSCRNRHCPKCQGAACAEWLADRQAELLPVSYFHIVFTMPAPIAEIAFQNKATVYAILFSAAAETQTRTHVDAPACRECGGVMRIVVEIPRRFHQSGAKAGPFHCDTS